MQNSNTPEIPDQNSEQDEVLRNDPVGQEIQSIRDQIAQMTNPTEIKEAKLRELAMRRESGEIDPLDYFVEQLYQYEGVPLLKMNLGNQALVLTREDLEHLGALEIVLKSGKKIPIEPKSLHPEDVLVIYPDELGNTEADIGN